MLQKVVNVISFRIEERRQIFTVSIDQEIPRFLKGDDQRLAQVITNLLSNAVKFTPEKGSIRLNAELAGEENGIYTIRIAVSDTGIGITAEQKSRLFTSFEQAESGTTRKFGGTGLGLAISKRIVEMMGGSVSIDSEPGKGSVFSFTFKAEKGQGVHTGIPARGVNTKNIRILAVDDSPDILEYLRDIMARLDINNIDTASSGEEALVLIEKKGVYDICFVDFKMPGMNGIELTEKIKELGSGKSIVIMISSADWSTIEEKAENAGVDKFLSKPLFPSPIVDIINECLGFTNINKEPELSLRRKTDNFGAYTMLLVEDVEINREIVLTLLEPTGLKIECAENGREALEKFSANPGKYTMIFMDVQMPEMDGYEATGQIRALDNKWAKEIPIVAMTANVFREDIEKCLQSGMNDHVGKPLDINDVMEKLRKYLNTAA